MRYALSIPVVLGCCAVFAFEARAQPQPPTTIACESTADCPLALVCEATRVVESCATAPAGNDVPASDAGCTIEEEPIEAPSCVYAPVSCTVATGCEGGLTCQPLGRVSECHSSPDPGVEPVCTERTESFCFPQRDDCAESSECDDGWRCAMLPESASNDPPAGWEGATKICVPEGIALFLEGRIKISRTATSSSSSEDRAASANVGGDIPADDGPVENTSACSAIAALPAFGPARHSGVPALMLLVLGSLVRRRGQAGLNRSARGSCTAKPA